MSMTCTPRVMARVCAGLWCSIPRPTVRRNRGDEDKLICVGYVAQDQELLTVKVAKKFRKERKENRSKTNLPEIGQRPLPISVYAHLCTLCGISSRPLRLRAFPYVMSGPFRRPQNDTSLP